MAEKYIGARANHPRHFTVEESLPFYPNKKATKIGIAASLVTFGWPLFVACVLPPVTHIYIIDGYLINQAAENAFGPDLIRKSKL